MATAEIDSHRQLPSTVATLHDALAETGNRTSQPKNLEGQRHV